MFLHQPRSTTSTQQKTELNQDVLKCFKIDFVLPTKNGFGIFPVLCLLFWKALKVATCCEQNPCGKKTPVSRHGGRHLGEFNIRRYGGSVVKQPWDVWIWNQERKLIGCNLVLGDFFFVGGTFWEGGLKWWWPPMGYLWIMNLRKVDGNPTPSCPPVRNCQLFHPLRIKDVARFLKS